MCMVNRIFLSYLQTPELVSMLFAYWKAVGQAILSWSVFLLSFCFSNFAYGVAQDLVVSHRSFSIVGFLREEGVNYNSLFILWSSFSEGNERSS